MNVLQHIDFDTLNALKGVMEDDFNFLIETFIQDSHDRLAKLQKFSADQDADNIRRAVHSFKGSCSNLGALRLASLCALLERKVLEGQCDDLAVDLLVIEEEFFIIKQMMLDFLK